MLLDWNLEETCEFRLLLFFLFNEIFRLACGWPEESLNFDGSCSDKNKETSCKNKEPVQS